MQIAFGILRLSPQEFWQMTPCEWMAALQGWRILHGFPEYSDAINRDELAALMHQFPDNIFCEE